MQVEEKLIWSQASTKAMKFESFIKDNGYGQTNYDSCVFMKIFSDSDFVILQLYPDDMLIVDHDPEKIKSLKNKLSKLFAKKDLRPAKKILDMRVTCDRKNMKL